MSNKTAVILAAGIAERWGDALDDFGGIKQFLDIKGERLISRMVRQLRERGCEPRILTRHPAIFKAHPDITELIDFTPQTLCHTALMCSKLWPSRELQFHGDVYWTEEGMDLATSWVGNDIRIIGAKPGEIFAFCIPPNKLWRMHELLQRVAKTPDIRGTSWQCYRSMNDMPLEPIRRPAEQRFDKNGMFYDLQDGTMEFDKPKEYADFLRREGVCE